MNLQLVGCSHHETPVEVRERISFTAQEVPQVLAEFRAKFPQTEAVLLSTCNRTELYTAAEDSAACPPPPALIDFLAGVHGLNAQELHRQLFTHRGIDAVRHLFMVAASLDSMVVGEAQILSQVKDAYQVAQLGQFAGQLTHSVFQTAMRVAKRVATETTIHQRRVSVPSVAIRDFASQIFDRFDDKKVVVIGAGEMGEETLQYLIDAHARDVTIVNRNPARAEALARQYRGVARPWEALDQLLVEADLIISTTGAAEPIVSVQRFERIIQDRFQRPLFVLDLAIPRDFDPAIGEMVGVYLYGIDDLRDVCDANRQARESEWPQALQIVDEETTRFVEEMQRRATGPTIRQLIATADLVKQAEIDRLLNKLNLDPQSEQEVRYAFDRLVNKLLHPPLESLRQEEPGQAQERLLASFKRLFKL
jgi:glutamyl-tRNA reductase